MKCNKVTRLQALPDATLGEDASSERLLLRRFSGLWGFRELVRWVCPSSVVGLLRGTVAGLPMLLWTSQEEPIIHPPIGNLNKH